MNGLLMLAVGAVGSFLGVLIGIVFSAKWDTWLAQRERRRELERRASRPQEEK